MEGEAEQFIIAIQQVADGALGYDNPTVNQGVMDFRDTAVVAVALGPDKGDDIKAELVLRQSKAPFGFRSIGLPNLRAVGVETAFTEFAFVVSVVTVFLIPIMVVIFKFNRCVYISIRVSGPKLVTFF